MIQAGFADARLAHHGHHLAAAGLRVFERLIQLFHLGRPADERRQPPRGRGLEPRSDCRSADDLVHLDRLRETLHRRRADRSDLDVPLGQRQGVGGEHGRPGIGELFHARGQMRRLPHRRVVHPEVAADRPHHDLAGVQPNSDTDRDPLSPPDLFGVSLHRLLHPERGVAGAHGMVLVGQGGPEERHDAVPHDLIDRALVAVDRLHHPLEHGVEEVSRLFGIAIGEDLHRALEVGEEHGHLLALAFQGAPRGENLLGEVLGRVRIRCAESRRGAGLARGMRTL